MQFCLFWDKLTNCRFFLCYVLKCISSRFLHKKKDPKLQTLCKTPKMKIKVISLAICEDIYLSQIGKQIQQLTMYFVKQMWFYRNVMHCWRHAKYQRPRVFSWSLKIKCSIYPLNLVTCVIQLYATLLFISN